MIFAGRIAGNSGAVKSLLLGPREPPKVAFLGGLVIGGVLMKVLLPTCFAASPPAPSLSLAMAGLAVGLGTALCNGCTSGHGLCGLSRLSVRSLVAVPTFMVAAMATATLITGGVVGTPLPVAATPASTLNLASKIAMGLAAALPPCFLMSKEQGKDTYVGLWSGFCFAVGLSIGGMVRPSVVMDALSLRALDGTLWVLFISALAVTFVFYRVASLSGVKAASALNASAPAVLDAPLIVGAVLFGVGWGASGLCPGPHIVGIAANPTAAGPLLMAAAVALGMGLKTPVSELMSK